MKVLIIAESASAAFGGEAAIPLHLFRILRERGIPTWLVTHQRTRAELIALLPGEQDYIRYIPDTIWHKLLYHVGCKFPARISNFTFGLISRLLTQWLARRIGRRLVRDEKISVVHQPIPVSPKEISLIRNMGAPVIIGPMNGGMTFPPAFAKRDNLVTSLFTQIGRKMSGAFHVIFPGKKQADLLLVANQRTRDALPAGVRGKVIELVENGVNLDVWQEKNGDAASFRVAKTSCVPVSFVFLGRLVDWKAVDLLLHAFKKTIETTSATLTIVGDGPLRAELAALTRTLDLDASVHFAGWKTQAQSADILAESDALVLPSLYECGGAVVLEAMAVGLPVIATKWGGPADYLDPSCGILVEPHSAQSFVDGLAAAMNRLATDPDLRAQMGAAGRRKIVEQYDWQRKVDRFLELYRSVAGEAGANSAPTHLPAHAAPTAVSNV